MLPLTQPTCHFHFLPLMASKTVLGQSSVPVCPCKIPRMCRADPDLCPLWHSIQCRQRDGLLQHVVIPSSLNPPLHLPVPLAPSAMRQSALPQGHPGQLQHHRRLATRILSAKQGAPGRLKSIAPHQKPTMLPAPHQTKVQHRNLPLTSDSVWHHCAL